MKESLKGYGRKRKIITNKARNSCFTKEMYRELKKLIIFKHFNENNTKVYNFMGIKCYKVQEVLELLSKTGNSRKVFI